MWVHCIGVDVVVSPMLSFVWHSPLQLDPENAEAHRAYAKALDKVGRVSVLLSTTSLWHRVKPVML